jgi:hypothetical protein
MSAEIARMEWSARSHAEYLRNHVLALRPVILTGAFDQWPARRKWTPEFFKEKYADLKVLIHGHDWRMADLIDRVLASTPQAPAPYLNQQLVEDWPAELLADISPVPECTRPNWVESRWFPSRFSYRSVQAFIGGVGAKFPFLHFDHWHLNTWIMQIYGDKEFVIFAPDQTRFMYPIGGVKENISSVNSVEAPDPERFPLFAEARGYSFIVRPGETVFMPAGWWHTARILSPSISMAMSGANPGNWAGFTGDLLRAEWKRNWPKALFLSAYLPVFAAAMARSGSR